MWKRLSDPNTLPLIGAYMDGPELVMVSEWMDNGNIKQYLERNSRVNKPALASALPHFWLVAYLFTSATAGRCCTRRGLFTLYEYRPRGSERGHTQPFHLEITALI